MNEIMERIDNAVGVMVTRIAVAVYLLLGEDE